MMKQFLRVKQIADQKFQRSDKSRVLSEELNAAEKRVDLIKESCWATGKKLSACMQRLTPDPVDRRSNTKKIPEATLAHCMEEWGLTLGENSILGMTLVDYARIQETLANDLLNYKLQVEEKVVEPLQNILSVDINKIMKYRKQLFKLTSEMDASKTRYQSAQRSSHQATGNGATSAAAKAQLLKEEAEDIVSRVDQCRDSLTAEMFNLISREPEMSQVFVKLCQLQLEHHRKAFYMLESALPELEAQIKSCAYQPVFGVPLEEHLKVTKREIAIVIESCICWLLESAIEEEGLFRIGGSMIKIKKMKSAFDAGFHHLLDEERDPHNVAGILKLYLRSLPEPLLTYQLYDHWMEAAIEPDHDARLKALWSVVHSLPETHFKNLRYLIKFLSRLCQNSDLNKMSVQNVAIVIGPNLIWPHVEESALGMNMTATNLHSSIVDTLITYSEWFFPGDCEFYVSTPTSPRHIDGFPPSLYGSQLSLSTARLSNGDSAVDSMSSSPTNSPKSPSPRVPVRPRKKAAPRAPQSLKNPIMRSVSCSGFQASVLARANSSTLASSLSISHENLLNAGYGVMSYENGKQIGTDGELGNYDIGQPQPPVVERRPKPPRQNRNGLPPVAERNSRRSVGRPSVPPPERPDSFSKSESVSSASPDPETSPYDGKILDPEDISISLDSSESESYNECQMSFVDDSDSEGIGKTPEDKALESCRVSGSYSNGTTAEVKAVASVGDDSGGGRSCNMDDGDYYVQYEFTSVGKSKVAKTKDGSRGSCRKDENYHTGRNPEEKVVASIEDGTGRSQEVDGNCNNTISGNNISSVEDGTRGSCNMDDGDYYMQYGFTSVGKSSRSTVARTKDGSCKKDGNYHTGRNPEKKAVASIEDGTRRSHGMDGNSNGTISGYNLSSVEDGTGGSCSVDGNYQNGMTADMNADYKTVARVEDGPKGSFRMVGNLEGDTTTTIDYTSSSCHVDGNYHNGMAAGEITNNNTITAIDDSTEGSFEVDGNYSNGRISEDKTVSGHCNGTNEVRPDPVLRTGKGEGLGGHAKKPVRAHISWEDHKNSDFDPDKFGSVSTRDGEDVSNTCHFTGGTPTWFDHYGDDKRQSNTLWFRNNEMDPLLQKGEDRRSTLCSIDEDTDIADNFRTVIEVGNDSKISYRSTVSGMAIKLRVNSETQDTRL